MSEADWWLCARCNSLNNLAARKCYSCRQRKPKDAVRASQHLGYVPIVSWDGKVVLHERPLTPDEATTPAAVAPRPIRDPIPRDILAVAPRPPHPARITYRVDEPVPAPTAHLSQPPPLAPHMTLHGAMVPPRGVPRPWTVPPGGVVPPPGAVPPGGVVPPGGSVPPGGAVPPPLVPVGPGSFVGPEVQPQPWPHWRELLDGPRPHAERLRRAREPETGAGAGVAPTSARPEGRTLSEAIREAHTGTASAARTFIPWPEADRPAARSEGPGSRVSGPDVRPEASRPSR